MKSIRIISRHATLAAAVLASGIDLSYNPEIAQQRIKDADTPCRRAQELGIGATERAYVVDINGETEVLNVYTANGVRGAMKFSPFVSCLDNRDMELFAINDLEGVITDTGARFPKTKASRAVLAAALPGQPEMVVLSI